MRNFEERKEEIFRRSQARIAQRKKTVRRALVTCVPLVLCVSVASFWLLSGFGKSAGAPDSAVNMELNYGAAGDVPESPECAPWVQSLQISNGSMTRVCTDADIMQMLMGVLEAPESSDNNSAVPESADEFDGKQGADWVTGNQIIEGDPYPLALIYADGTKVWYTLRGNRLTREDGQTYMLTDEQSAALHALLEE